MTIEGQVVVITGASSGIGKATAVKLAKLGAKVMLSARREAQLKAIVAQIKADGGVADYQVTDVTKFADMQQLVQATKDKFKRVDVLYSNAGVMPVATLDNLSIEEINAMVDINIKGVLHGIKATLPIFHEQGSGHFIATASNSAHVINPRFAVYSATKFAVRAIMDGLRQEEIGNNILSTIISPGAVNTNLYQTSSDPQTRAELKDVEENRGINPTTIADAVVYALSQPDNIGINEVLLREIHQDD